MKNSLRISTLFIANNHHFTMGMQLFALIFSLLTGCTALPDKPVRPAVYDFGPGANSQPVLTAARLPALTLADIDAPAAFGGTAMLYRLAYADVQQLHPYAQARWSMPPAQLVRQRLSGQLSLQRAVLKTGEGAAPASLRLELEEFTHVFETPGRSSGLVRLRATLYDSAGGRERQLAQRSFVTRSPAPSADAPGGVRALTAATDAAINDIADWLRQVPQPAR